MIFSKHFVRLNMYAFALSGLAILWLSITGIKEMRSAEICTWLFYGAALLVMAGFNMGITTEADTKERRKFAKEVAEEALKMYDIRQTQAAKNTATTERITGGET